MIAVRLSAVCVSVRCCVCWSFVQILIQSGGVNTPPTEGTAAAGAGGASNCQPILPLLPPLLLSVLVIVIELCVVSSTTCDDYEDCIRSVHYCC